MMALLIQGGVIRPIQKVIHGDFVKVGQLNEDIGGNIHIAALVIAVDALAAMQDLADGALGHVLVLPQIADSLVDHVDPSQMFVRIFYPAKFSLLTFSEKFAKMNTH